MKDFEDKELKIGDIVISSRDSKEAYLYKWKVIGLTPTGVKLKALDYPWPLEKTCRQSKFMYKV